MLVGKLAVLLSCRGVLLGLFMLADRVMVLRLMMVMRGCMMVSSCVVMVLTRWMFRFLCHFDALVCASSGVGMYNVLIGYDNRVTLSSDIARRGPWL